MVNEENENKDNFVQENSKGQKGLDIPENGVLNNLVRAAV